MKEPVDIRFGKDRINHEHNSCCFLIVARFPMRSNEALEMMENAILADKKNPLPMYQKANIPVSMERLDEALDVLEELKQYAPCESSVYALMGRIYKRRNIYDKAMLNFGLALDLKPSAIDVATIKVSNDAIEALRVSYKKMNLFCVPFATTNMGSTMLAMDLGWMGPNYSISTACATSNFCILNAANHIIRGEAGEVAARKF